jgi:hypothetical protein
MPRRLPITALVYDGVMARTYLAYLRSKGFTFRRVLYLIEQGRSPLASLLPARLRNWYARRAQAAASMYWVRRLPQTHPELFATVSTIIGKQYELPSGFHAGLWDDFDFTTFGEETIELPVAGLRDPALVSALSALEPGPLLFTGGGILPDAITSDPQRPLIHVHPGWLPAIRGADGLLWSTALLGCPSASCFVMAPGLDTGRAIAAIRFPALTFPVGAGRRPDAQTLYRMLYAYYDPLLRAKLLLDVVEQAAGDGMGALIENATPQDLTQGRTYNFMHPVLRAAVLERIFTSDDN